jgi:hypothetical protein
MFEDRFEERIASTLDAADDLDDQPDTDEPTPALAEFTAASAADFDPHGFRATQPHRPRIHRRTARLPVRSVDAKKLGFTSADRSVVRRHRRHLHDDPAH